MIEVAKPHCPRQVTINPPREHSQDLPGIRCVDLGGSFVVSVFVTVGSPKIMEYNFTSAEGYHGGVLQIMIGRRLP